MSVVSATFAKRGTCPVCGKKVRRSVRFTEADIDPATLDGFTGTTRTARVALELQRMGDEWFEHGIVRHRACESVTVVSMPTATLKGNVG